MSGKQQQETWTLEGCDIEHETENAVLVRYTGGEVWIPLSQVHKITRAATGTRQSSVRMTAWIAKRRGLL